jgi:hypothetical protein
MSSLGATQQSQRRYEGLNPEELDREAQIGRPHHLRTRDRRAVGALLLFFGALLVIALAMMMLVRAPQTEAASKNSDGLVEALIPSVE